MKNKEQEKEQEQEEEEEQEKEEEELESIAYLLFTELVGPALEDLEDLGTALDLTRQERDGGEGILDICQRRGGRGDKGG